jgi:hypothetical protein
MLCSKTSKFAILVAVCLLSVDLAGSAHAGFVATEWSGDQVINLGGLPGSTSSYASRQGYLHRNRTEIDSFAGPREKSAN